MCRVERSLFSRSRTRQPSMSGSWRSSVTASGTRSRASETASAPRAVTMALNPFSCAMSSRKRAKFSSLSTMRRTLSPGWMTSRSSATSSGEGAVNGSGSRAASRSDMSVTTPVAAAGTVHARETDLAAQEPGDLAADREAEARSAVLAARRAVGLLERLEDDLLLVGGDPDSRVANRDREDAACLVEDLVIVTPPALGARDRQDHLPALGELEGVREHVLDDLLKALRVSRQGVRQSRIQLDPEVQPLRRGDVAERALDVILQVSEPDVADVDDDRAGLDLREVEDVVDQVQEVVSRRVDRLGEL